MDFIGYALAFIFFAINLYLFYKKKYPGKIVCYFDQQIPLLHSIVDSFEDVKIMFKNSPINKQLVILKMLLVNVGYRDITSEIIKTPIVLKLPDFTKIYNLKILPSNPAIISNQSIIDDNSVKIEFDCLRVNEYLQLELLVDDNSFGENSKIGTLSNISKNNLNFSHRIIDTEKIKVETLPVMKQGYRTPWIKIWSVIIFMVLIICFLIFLPSIIKHDSSTEMTIMYPIVKKDSILFYAEVKSNNLTTMQLINEEQSFKKIISIDSLNSPYDKEQLSVRALPFYNAKSNFILETIFIFISLVFLIFFIKQEYKMNEFRKIFIKDLVGSK